MIKQEKLLYKTDSYSSFNNLILGLEQKYFAKNAFVYKEKKEELNVTYSQLAKDVAFVLKGFEKNKISKKHIAVMGRNSYYYALMFLSCLCSDNVFVPVDKDLTEEQMVNLINHSESEVLFIDTKYAEKVKNNLDKFTNINKIVLFDECDILNGEIITSFGEYTDNYKDVIKNDNKDINRLALLIYTSGTTGDPKGVMLSEKNILSCGYNGARICPVLTKGLSVLPYHHTYEESCGLLVSLWCGATICINSALTKVLAELNYYKPDYMVIVPAFAELFYKNIMKNVQAKGKEKTIQIGIKISQLLLKMGIDIRRKLFKEIHDAFGGNLKKIYCGGAPINPETARFFEKIGVKFICGYGITECSPLVSGNTDKFNDHSTVGLPIPCVEVEIRDKTDEGIGEICVKGETVMLGYFKNEEATKEVIKDGWFYTGDFGFFNQKGQLTISGRKKNIIVLSNGKNVYPEEIEEKLKEIEEIKEIVVRGIEEDGYTKSLLAEIYPDEEKQISEQELFERVKAVLSEFPPYKRIEKIVLRDEPFVKTTTKKIKR